MLPLALHLPDGFMTPTLAAVGWALVLLPLMWALRAAEGAELEAEVSRMGLLAAFLLVAQSIMIPIASGTSAHLQGSALLALTLGPARALVVMAAVLGIQALVLGDGGMLTLGWNLWNMGVVGCWSAWGVGRLAQALGAGRQSTALGAAWCSIQFSTLALCAELAVAGTTPLQLSLPAMFGLQSLVALGEGLATFGALQILAGVSAPSSYSICGVLGLSLPMLMGLAPALLGPLPGLNWMGPAPVVAAGGAVFVPMLLILKLSSLGWARGGRSAA